MAEVVEYHDILTDSDVAYLVKAGTNREPIVAEVNEGTVVTGEKVGTVTTSRLSTIHWLALNHSAETARIGKLMNRVTGLKVLNDSYAVMQVVEYGPGGHYVPHTDSVRGINALEHKLRFITGKSMKI